MAIDLNIVIGGAAGQGVHTITGLLANLVAGYRSIRWTTVHKGAIFSTASASPINPSSPPGRALIS
jgi:hypothetical protein